MDSFIDLNQRFCHSLSKIMTAKAIATAIANDVSTGL